MTIIKRNHLITEFCDIICIGCSLSAKVNDPWIGVKELERFTAGFKPCARLYRANFCKKRVLT